MSYRTVHASTSLWRAMAQQILQALGTPLPGSAALQVQGAASWPGRYPVSDLACASIGAAAVMLARWRDPSKPASVRVDRALASWWFGFSIRPDGWVLPKVRSPVTGDYAALDGWIRIHANARHHRERALQVLGLAPDADYAAVAARVQTWRAQELEEALVAHAACAAALRAPAVWRDHPQGRAVAAEPLVLWLAGDDGAVQGRPPGVDPQRPLRGLRILDLTRVFAGPVATRFLAAYGARVLRLDPPDWDEPGTVPEMTLGKYCAGLDLHRAPDRARFERLLTEADVLVHGYRPGALDALGFGPARRAHLRPGLVDVSLDAWGWSGPWRDRRGFDSLVQMSTGIAWPDQAGGAPDPLPVQALDQATGYLMAACVLQGLVLRRARGCGSVWRVSLARMAHFLMQGHAERHAVLGVPQEQDFGPWVEPTPWGPARRLKPPCRVGSLEWQWDQPASALRSAPARWVD